LDAHFFLQARFSSILASEKQAIAGLLPHLMRKSAAIAASPAMAGAGSMRVIKRPDRHVQMRPEPPLADGACRRCRLSLQAAARPLKKSRCLPLTTLWTVLLSECHEISRIPVNIGRLASCTETGSMEKFAAEKSDFLRR
jgi:hypothetical protein